MTLLVGAATLGIAFVLARGKGEKQFRNMVTLFSIATAPVGIPMLAGLLSRRITNAAAALAGAITGVASASSSSASGRTRSCGSGADLETREPPVPSTASSTLVTMIVGEHAIADPQQPHAGAHRRFPVRLRVPIGQLP